MVDKKKLIFYIKYSKEDSIYATHMLNSIHQCGKIDEIWKIVLCKESQLMNIKKSVFIYVFFK
jgi:hypothetical protein